MDKIIVQAEFIIEKLFLNDIDSYLRNGLTFDPIWIKENELFLKTDNNELSAFAIKTTVSKKELTMEETQKAANEAAEDLESYLQICSLLTDSSPVARLVSISHINSINEAGNNKIPPFSVQVKNSSIEEPPSANDIEEVKQYFPILIQTTKILHNKYYKILQASPFLRLAGSHHRISRNDLIPDIFRFVSTISSLESLFNEAPSDIKYKLQLRCSFLLGLIGNDVLQTKDQDLTDELKIFEDLKDSYNARNDLLHGVGFRKVQKINIQKIIHYAKRSIICFYVLCDKLQPMTNKEQVLNAIDKAILNHIEKDALKVKINEGLREFVPNVPERFT